MESVFRLLKKIIPASLFEMLQPLYHRALATLGAIIYRAPSRKIYMIGVTGTKGKSSTTEILNALLEGAGYKTALVNGIRFKVGEDEVSNRLKMTMPGRFLIQKKIREAVNAGCTHFILEMTSEGAKQFRHKNMNLDMLLFTNLSPEHIESHGSYEKYVAAKLSIAEEMLRGNKKKRVIIANADDEKGRLFLGVPAEQTLGYSLDDVDTIKLRDDGTSFDWRGTTYISPLRGTFSIYNSLAALFAAEHLGVAQEVMRESLEAFGGAKGRLEKVVSGQNFEVIVDYAHTADSLRQLYEAFPERRKICVLGSTGGGRDTWKRPEMGRVADAYCDVIILTNEDPYDEDPEKIIHEVKEGVRSHAAHVVMDRREAIARALSRANKGDVVIISGKGTDPYIMEADGKKTPWSDSQVAREELEKLLS